MGARRPIIPRRPCNGGPGTGAEHPHRPEGGYAWELINRTACQSQAGITVLLLGPATNLAIALLRYPALRQHIRQIILAGGSFGFGDAGPYSERNVFEDAYACKVLLNSGIPMTMIGLSAAAEAALTESRAAVGPGSLGGEPCGHLCERSGCAPPWNALWAPSLVAAAWMLNPEVAQTDHFHVEVEVNGTEMYGRTVIEWRHYLHEPEETEVAIHADREKLLACIRQHA